MAGAEIRKLNMELTTADIGKDIYVPISDGGPRLSNPIHGTYIKNNITLPLFDPAPGTTTLRGSVKGVGLEETIINGVQASQYVQEKVNQRVELARNLYDTNGAKTRTGAAVFICYDSGTTQYDYFESPQNITTPGWMFDPATKTDDNDSLGILNMVLNFDAADLTAVGLNTCMANILFTPGVNPDTGEQIYIFDLTPIGWPEGNEPIRVIFHKVQSQFKPVEGDANSSYLLGNPTKNTFIYNTLGPMGQNLGHISEENLKKMKWYVVCKELGDLLEAAWFKKIIQMFMGGNQVPINFANSLLFTCDDVLRIRCNLIGLGCVHTISGHDFFYPGGRELADLVNACKLGLKIKADQIHSRNIDVINVLRFIVQCIKRRRPLSQSRSRGGLPLIMGSIGDPIIINGITPTSYVNFLGHELNKITLDVAQTLILFLNKCIQQLNRINDEILVLKSKVDPKQINSEGELDAFANRINQGIADRCFRSPFTGPIAHGASILIGEVSFSFASFNLKSFQLNMDGIYRIFSRRVTKTFQFDDYLYVIDPEIPVDAVLGGSRKSKSLKGSKASKTFTRKKIEVQEKSNSTEKRNPQAEEYKKGLWNDNKDQPGFIAYYMLSYYKELLYIGFAVQKTLEEMKFDLPGLTDKKYDFLFSFDTLKKLGDAVSKPQSKDSYRVFINNDDESFLNLVNEYAEILAFLAYFGVHIIDGFSFVPKDEHSFLLNFAELKDGSVKSKGVTLKNKYFEIAIEKKEKENFILRVMDIFQQLCDNDIFLAVTNNRTKQSPIQLFEIDLIKIKAFKENRKVSNNLERKLSNAISTLSAISADKKRYTFKTPSSNRHLQSSSRPYRKSKYAGQTHRKKKGKGAMKEKSRFFRSITENAENAVNVIESLAGNAINLEVI
jgi:hypothetical protein